MNLSGNPIDFLFAFLAGVLISFTPCVYPLIPISASYIVSNAAGSKFKGLILSFVYTSGMAVAYATLGLIAALSGQIFGAISAHPITQIIVGMIIILFGIFMLDLFPITNLPKMNKLVLSGKPTYFPAFILGLSSSLIISTCLTPVLGTILAYIASKKNILYGAGLLLSFAYGMGLIFLIIGTFSSVLVNLPKPGKWMVYIKRICAFTLVAIGVYFIFNGIRRLL